MKYPFLTLPTEILNLILLHLSDDEDLRNLRDAFTVLSSRLALALVPASASASLARGTSSSPTTATEVNGSSTRVHHVYESTSTAISPALTHRPAAATARATATATSTRALTPTPPTTTTAQTHIQRQIKNLQLAINARLSDLRAEQLRIWHDTVRKRVMWPFYGARGGSGDGEAKVGVVR